VHLLLLLLLPPPPAPLPAGGLQLVLTHRLPRSVLVAPYWARVYLKSATTQAALGLPVMK